MKQMKNLLFLFLIGLGFGANAQQPHYDDLLMYFADGQYEKLVNKAKKYIGGDKTKNDPLPYYYSARANFEMSKDQKYDDDFPKAYNNAIGMAGKALKKDKQGELLDLPQVDEFYNDLKVSVVEEIKNMVDAGDYSRMRGTVMKLQRMDPNDVGSYFLLTAAQYQIKDKGSAKITLKKAQEKLNAIESVDSWRKIDLEMMQIGIIEYSNYLVKMRQCDKAKDILNKVKQWFEKDEDFMSKYDEIVNGGGC
jgi:tetratricopeptide (TPR) repeat protein